MTKPMTLGLARMTAAICGVAMLNSSPVSAVDLVALGASFVQDLTLDEPVLIAGRPVFIRLRVIVPGANEDTPGVDAIMRVFVDGQEIPESPIYSLNGPYSVPSHSDVLQEDHLINFLYIPPESSDVDFVFEVNPPGPSHIEEDDLTNNQTEVSDVVFECRAVPELLYVPIDYRPDGGDVADLPDEEFIKPGIGDGFVRGIYPTSDWNYHRVPGLALLWQQNVNSSQTSLLNTLSSIRANTIPGLGFPEPDFIYGWLPGNPCSCNGIANGTPGDAAFGNSQTSRHQRTFAHELGHLFGMSHNGRSIGEIGVDVEHHLLDTEGLERMKATDKKDIMVAGLLTDEAWVDEITSNFMSGRPVLQCAVGAAGDPTASMLHITGVVDTATGAVMLDPVVMLSSPKTATPSAVVGADLRIDLFTSADPNAQSFYSVLVNTRTAIESCSTPGQSYATVALDVRVPAVGPNEAPVARVTVTRLVDGRIVAERVASSTAPQLSFVQPLEGASIDGVLHVSWLGADPDGDELHYHLLYSPDGQRFSPILVRSTRTEVEVPLDRLSASAPGGAVLRLIATDGMITTIVDRSLSRVGVRTDHANARGGEANRPDVNLITPNDGAEIQFGATVVLRAAAWDLEDLALEDGALIWTSELDGVIGMGRLTSVADLAVGTHTLTVTATDTDGNTDAESIVVTVVERDLPTDALCEGDANGDGIVDPLDTGFILARFGCSVGTGDTDCDAADQNMDSVVDPLDTGFVLARFGNCP